MNEKETKAKAAATAAEGLPTLEGPVVRRTWHQGRWWFVVVDVVAALTESPSPDGYLRDLRRRDEELSAGWAALVTPLPVTTPGGRQLLNCATLESVLRIIQSIPSPKAEPFKLWLAKVGNERVEEARATDFGALSENQRRLLLRGQVAEHTRIWLPQPNRRVSRHRWITRSSRIMAIEACMAAWERRTYMPARD